jgi:hypothetical protein
MWLSSWVILPPVIVRRGPWAILFSFMSWGTNPCVSVIADLEGFCSLKSCGTILKEYLQFASGVSPPHVIIFLSYSPHLCPSECWSQGLLQFKVMRDYYLLYFSLRSWGTIPIFFSFCIGFFLHVSVRRAAPCAASVPKKKQPPLWVLAFSPGEPGGTP